MSRIEEILKLISSRCAVSDNLIFKLHYRYTVLILVVFSLVVTCRLMWGDSFSCVIQDRSSAQFVENYCYAKGTYIIASSLNISVGKEVLHRGIEMFETNAIHISFKFYSWVNLLLLVHALNFYLPHLFWKLHEQGLVSRLSTGLDEFAIDECKVNENLKKLIKYFLRTQGKHVVYTCIYLFCEVLNFVIAIGQFVWLRHFFQVTDIPSNLSNVPMDTWSDFANYYFPMVSKCQFLKYGASGSIQRHDVMCNLPLNNLYMYMFLFLCAWYILLAVISGLVLIYRLILILPSVRYQVLTARSPLTSEQVLLLTIKRLSFSDWFFLFHLQKNILPDHFEEVLVGLSSANRSSLKNSNIFDDSSVM